MNQGTKSYSELNIPTLQVWCFGVNFGLFSHSRPVWASESKTLDELAHRGTPLPTTYVDRRACLQPTLMAQITLLIGSYLSSAFAVPGVLVNARDTAVNTSDTSLSPHELVSCNRKGCEKTKRSLS